MSEALETAELQTFVRVLEARSMTRAAKELGVPRPTVGRRLARLEAKLGVRLLRRTTRTMTPTAAGELFYAQARVALAAVRDAEASVRQREQVVGGLLRVTVPPLQSARFAELLAGFLAAHPAVKLELESTSQHVDLVGGNYDVALRAGNEFPPGLIARTLARTRLVAAAAPAYLRAHGVPKRTSDLAAHRCFVMYEGGRTPATHWPRWRGGALRVEHAVACNDLELLRALALHGQGIALLPLNAVYEELRDGALVPVLPERVGGEARVAVLYPEREFVAPAARAFIELLARWVSTEPMFARELPSCPAHPTPRPGAPRATKRPRATRR